MVLPLLSLFVLAAPPSANPPPDWTVMPAPMTISTARIAWSPDGRQIAMCGDAAVHMLTDSAPRRIAAHGCQDLAFDGSDVVYAVDRDEAQIGVWRSRPPPAAPERLTEQRARAVLVRSGRLWIAGADVTVREAGKIVAQAALPEVRRLVSTPSGVLAVGWRRIVLLDDGLKVVQTFTPAGEPKVNLYDAVALPGGRVAAVANGGDVWIWDATGRQIAHGRKIGNANWLAWTGAALVAGQMWLQVDPLRPIARAVHQPRSTGPAALSPDGKQLAIPLHQGVLIRGVTESVRVPRGVPSTTRGIVVTDDAVWVSDDYGQLLHFDRKGVVQAVYPVAASRLRDLVGDPAKTLYAATEWGDVIAWRPTGPHRRWPSRSAETLALSADGGAIYAGGQKTVDRFDTRTGAQTKMAKEPEDYSPFHPTLTPNDEVIWFRGGQPAVWHPKGKPPVSILKGSSGAFDVRGRLWINNRERKPAIYGWPKLNRIKRLPWMDDGRFVPLADGGMIVTGWGGQVQAFGPDGAERWSKRAPWHVGGAALLKAKAGDRLLTGGPDLTLSAWDLKTGARTAWAPAGRGQRVSGLAFSADGRFLAVGADATGVRVWDTKTHRMVLDLKVDGGEVVLSRAGADWIAHIHNRAFVWPVAGGQARVVQLGEVYNSYSNRAPTHGAFVLRERDGRGHVIDLRTGATLWTLAIPDDVRVSALSDDGQRVAMLIPGELTQLQVHTRAKPTPKGIKGPINDVAWHGETLLVWQDDAAFEWHPKGLRPRPKLPRFAGKIASAGARLAISDVSVVRVQDGPVRVGTLPIEMHGGAHIRLSPDGKVLAIGGTHTGSVVLWSVESGRAIARYEAFADGIWRSTDAAGAVLSGATIGARD